MKNDNTPTPRTDAAEIYVHDGHGCIELVAVKSDFARQLERELAEAKREIMI